MKKYFIAIFLLFPAVAFCQSTASLLKDGKILVKEGNQVKSIDYSQDNKYTTYDLDKWEVREEGDLVQEALEVYQKKSQPLYSQKVWFIDKGDGHQKFFVEYTSEDQEERILFTEDQNFGFYIGLSDVGESYLYAINLSNQTTSPVTRADDFFVNTCNGQSSYVAVQRDGEEQTFYIFNETGEHIADIKYDGSIKDLNQVYCY